MGESKDKAIRHLESIVNKESDMVDFYLSLSAQPPAPKKTEDEPQETFLMDSIQRATGAKNGR